MCDEQKINPEKLVINQKYKDWEDMKNALSVIEEIRKSDDEHRKNAIGFFNFPKGKKLQLTVEVNDPDLVNAILTSEWGNAGLMPGMTVTNVRFKDLDGEGIVANWLREKLKEFEQKGV